MRGSLEAPPIIVRGSRLKTASSLVLLGLAVAFLVRRLREDWADDQHALVFIILGGAIVTLLIVDLIRPARLVLDWRGLTQSRLWGRRRWSWDEIGDFRVAPRGVGRCIAFDFPGGRGDGGLAAQDAPLGADAFLAGGWELAPHRLASLLNQAKQHWSTPQL